jgi:hypothetical protein
VNAVIERCTNCGVEHEPSHVGPCEVCGSELRYCCQRHSREIGWLDGPACPVCARETEARRARPAPAPPPPVERPTPARPTMRRPARRPRRPDPREVLREGAGEILPHVATGASLAIRVVRAIFILVRTVFLWALLGAAAAIAYAYLLGGEVLWLMIFGLSNGAAIGLFLGIILALGSIFTRATRS